MTYAFSDYLEEVGLSPLPDWTKQVIMPFEPRRHQLIELYKALENDRWGDFSDPGTGKTVPAQALALARCLTGNKVVIIQPPKLIEQFKQSLQQTFPGHPFTVDTFNEELNHRQVKVDQWEEAGWPDILLTTYRSFVGHVEPTYRKRRLKEQEFEAKKQGNMEGWRNRFADLLQASLASGYEGLSILAVSCLFAFSKEAERSKTEPRKVSLDGEQVNWKTFKDRGYTMLIVDEAQNAKGHTSQIHQAIKQFVEPDNGLLLMTGTPIHNTPEDAFGMLNLIAPCIYCSAKQFEYEHCIKQPMRVGFDPITGRDKIVQKTIGYKDLAKLHRNLYLRARRVTKAEVLDLPPILVSDLPVALSREHHSLYRKMVEEQMLEFEDGSLLDFTTQQRLYQSLQQVLVNPELIARTEIKHNTMLETLDTLLDSLGGKKVVVGVWYQASVEKLMKRYAEFNPACLYGGVVGTKAEAMKQKFIHDPECRIIFTQYSSGGVGVDGFQHVCSHMAALELVSVPGLFDQWVSRLNRSGQKESVNIYIMSAVGTLSVQMRKNLLEKEETMNEVVMDKKKLLKTLLGE
jgi:SNF2 family DNA or RNA helicase